MANRNQDISFFLSFCIEQYKHKKGIKGEEAMNILAENGILDYLYEHYEILHTQSAQWITEEIESLIEAKKGGEL